VTGIDTALPVLPELAASVVAGPVTLVGAGAAAKVVSPVSPVGVSPHLIARANAARVGQQLTDGLFTALGHGTVERAELAILDSGAEQAVLEALAAQMSTAASAQADLDRLLWDRQDSSWQDGKSQWLL